MKANIGIPFFSSFEVDPALDWQMSRAEKYGIIQLMQTLQPDVAIEIGTYKGGSLQVISKYAGKVYSIDISPAPKKFLERKFSNVEFIVGEGHKIIHSLFKEIDSQNRRLDFILVDGDHTKKGVSDDLNAIFAYPHKHPLTIILHDSFNPQCRKGIKSINYSEYPMVEYVELDYITGSFWHNDTYREMWGGFAMIKLDPSKKTSGVEIHESQGHLFNCAHLASTHLIKDPLRFLGPIKKTVLKMMGKKHRSAIYDSFD